MVPSESTQRFSELSAVPIEASDSRVSSSDARGSRLSISKVNSSLHTQTSQILTRVTGTHVAAQLTCKSRHATFSGRFNCGGGVYFSFWRLSICSVSTLSSCCMAACWCSEMSLKESTPSSSPLSSITTSDTDCSRGLTGGEGTR